MAVNWSIPAHLSPEEPFVLENYLHLNSTTFNFGQTEDINFSWLPNDESTKFQDDLDDLGLLEDRTISQIPPKLSRPHYYALRPPLRPQMYAIHIA